MMKRGWIAGARDSGGTGAIGRAPPDRCPSTALALLVSALVGCAARPAVTFERDRPSVRVHRAALYPETIEYSKKRDRFLLGSFREGSVYEVDVAGQVSRLVDDDRLCSVLGIAVDGEHGRLWAVSSDLGSGVRPSAAGPKNLAAVGVYDLATGAPIDYVDLAHLAPGPHLLNGIAVDAAGDAYITDSFSPIIYKVDPQGRASVFVRDERFAGEGINLNGLVVHPDGYLLVVKKSDGALFRVPLAHPEQLSKVDVAQGFIGGDGLLLIGKKELVIIANRTPGAVSNAAFALSSEDGWASAKVDAALPLGDVYPTTAVLRDGRIYVVHTKLDELLRSPPEQRAGLRMEATIEEIGRVGR